jgi:hypothetical protein
MKLRVPVLVAALVVWVCGATVAHAQFWEKKDWKTWSKGDCEKLLKDSPWARPFENSIYREGATGLGTGTGGFHGENRASLQYFVQLRSALPIRQAIIRLAMIENKYDKMSEQDRKAFDERAQEYLNQSFANRIVVHVTYKTNLQEIDRYLAEYWQQAAPNVIPTTGDIIGPKGDRVRPVRFISEVGGSREFELIFPREMNGETYINEVDKGFSIELPDIPQVILDNFRSNRQDVRAAERETQKTEQRALIQFDVRKMKFQDKLEY